MYFQAQNEIPTTMSKELFSIIVDFLKSWQTFIKEGFRFHIFIIRTPIPNRSLKLQCQIIGSKFHLKNVFFMRILFLYVENLSSDRSGIYWYCSVPLLSPLEDEWELLFSSLNVSLWQ